MDNERSSNKSIEFQKDLLYDLLPGFIHEINNPLGALSMYTTVFMEDIQGDAQNLDPEISQRYLEYIEEMTISIQRIMNLIKSVSSLVSKQNLKTKMHQNLIFFLKEVLTINHKRIKNRLQIEINSQKSEKYPIQIEPAKILIVLSQGLETILKSTEKQIKLEINLRKSNMHKNTLACSFTASCPLIRDTELVKVCKHFEIPIEINKNELIFFFKYTE
ncbi:MAG: hypothetical protein ACQES9_09430 [Myxococcota bacterium]